MRPQVSVVVVSFNTREKLRRCLSAIEPEHETIVVDNASSDGSADMVAKDFPAVKLVRSDRNLGFGKANNVGIGIATGDLILLLNSDCYAEPGAISQLASVFHDARVVAAGGRLLNPDGSLQQSVAGPLRLWYVFLEQTYLDALVRRVFPKAAYWRTHYALRKSQDTGASQVAQVMGACLMMRPGELFDERFFLYCEDTELCHRLRRRGEIVYVPGARFVHELGSSSLDRWRSVALYNYGKELFFRIHHGQLQSFACLLIDRAGALLRMLVWTLLLRPAKVKLFWKVLTSPRSGPSGS